MGLVFINDQESAPRTCKVLIGYDKPIAFDFSMAYMGSLAYLAVFGSILAFGAYLTLIGKIGPDKAAYVLIMIPIIAVSLSIVFEDYPFGGEVVAGIVLILAGNIVVLRKRKPA